MHQLFERCPVFPGTESARYALTIHCQFVVTEQVRIIGVNQRTGEILDLRGDGLANGLGQGLGLGTLFR